MNHFFRNDVSKRYRNTGKPYQPYTWTQQKHIVYSARIYSKELTDFSIIPSSKLIFSICTYSLTKSINFNQCTLQEIWYSFQELTQMKWIHLQSLACNVWCNVIDDSAMKCESMQISFCHWSLVRTASHNTSQSCMHSHTLVGMRDFKKWTRLKCISFQKETSYFLQCTLIWITLLNPLG